MHATATLGVSLALIAGAACKGSPSPANLCSSSGAAATVSATDNLVFSPGSVPITHGQSVSWQNVGMVPHTVTDDGSTFNSPLAAGQTFVHTFSAAGPFSYHRNIHPGMVGTITVN